MTPQLVPVYSGLHLRLPFRGLLSEGRPRLLSEGRPHLPLPIAAWALVLKIVLAQGLGKSHLVRTASHNAERCLASIKLEPRGPDVLKGHFQPAAGRAQEPVSFSTLELFPEKSLGRGHLKLGRPPSPVGL